MSFDRLKRRDFITLLGGAAAELKVSKATVSKAVSRIEARLRTRLINRTSRRFVLTDAGRQLAVRAAHILPRAKQLRMPRWRKLPFVCAGPQTLTEKNSRC